MKKTICTIFCFTVVSYIFPVTTFVRTHRCQAYTVDRYVSGDSPVSVLELAYLVFLKQAVV